MTRSSWSSKTTTAAALAALLLLSSAPLAAAAHQDDAGSGGDAPDDWDLAMAVSPGTFQGGLFPGEGDHEDWYRALMPAGKGLRIAVTPPAGSDFDLVVLSDTGALLGYSWLGGSAVDAVTTGSPTAGVRIGVLHWSGSGVYSLDVEVVDLPDVRVVGLEVVPAPLITDAGPVPDAGPVSIGTQRRVVATLRNDGVGAAEGNLVGWVRQGGTYRDLSPAPISIPPGQEVTVTLTWDATGQVGDAEVHVLAAVPADLDPADNAASTGSYAVLGNVGWGVDALNQWNGVFLPLFGAAAGTYYDGYGTGAAAYASAPFVFAGVFAGASKEYGPYAIACAYVAVGTCVGA